METTPKLTPEQRHENMEIIERWIDDGTLTIDDLNCLDPRDTSIEHVYAVKRTLQQRGGLVLRAMSGL